MTTLHEGAIIRSRAQWFKNLAKRNKIKRTLGIVQKSNGSLSSNPKHILDELRKFYSNLYGTKNSALCMLIARVSFEPKNTQTIR